MENTNGQLSVITPEGKLAAINAPRSCKDFFAAKLGITIPKSTKDKPFTMKDVLALPEALKLSKDTIKAYRKEHAASVTNHYAMSAVFGAALMADARFRKNARSSTDKKGNVNGWNISVRRERSSTASAAAQIATLTAQVARLTAALGAPAITA